MLRSRRRIAPLEPTEENERSCIRSYKLLSPPSNLYLSFRAPYTASGLEHLPKEPALYLANHVSIFDPFMLILAVQHPVHFMATESAFNDPFFGRVLRTFGSIPKKKFTSDVSAIRIMKKWKDVGGHLGVFPEGQRSWDGTLQPLLPGIENLVRMLRLPLVTVRLLNVDRQAPRWADYMRKGRVHLEFDPPRIFERKADPKAIRQYIEERLHVDQQTSPRWPVRGKKLARGVANPVFACPACHSLDGLVESDDEVECRACRARWGVDTTNTLQGISGGAQSLSITEAMAGVRAHIKDAGMLDPKNHALFESDGVILRSEEMELLDITGREPELVTRGKLQLTRAEIEVVDGSGSWRIPLHDVSAVSVDLRRRLLIRGPERLYEAVLPTQSPLKWEWLTHHWRDRGKEEMRSKSDS